MLEKEETIATLLNPEEGVQQHLLSENRTLKRDIDMWKNRTTKLTEDLADGPTSKNVSLDENLKARAKVLERENAALKIQVDKLNASLLEELEDIKFNYKESVRLNLKYETVIRDLGQKAGQDVRSLIGH